MTILIDAFKSWQISASFHKPKKKKILLKKTRNREEFSQLDRQYLPKKHVVRILQFSSVQLLSHVQLFVTPWTAACEDSLSITNTHSLPKVCPLSWWCHQTISSSVVPFSSCPQFFPASGSFQMSQLFASDGQSIGVSASTSALPLNTQDGSP